MKFFVKIFMLLLAFGAVLNVLADDDEVKFHARKYRSRKSGEFKSYTSSKTQRVKTFNAKSYDGKNLPAYRSKAYHEKPFEVHRREGSPDLPVYVGETQDEKAFKQQRHIVVRSIPADPRKIKEKKPFISGVGKQRDKEFVAKEKSRAKNPLLKPRQGIKEYAPDAE